MLLDKRSVPSMISIHTSLIIFLFITLSTTSGQEINGRIIDASTNEPIEFVSIYVNGTTKGTISDSDGRFTLSIDMEQCEIIINHVGYEAKTINFSNQPKADYNIKLKPKNLEIPHATIGSVNLRELNLEYFKNTFLGTDKWGTSAKILNDSVIFFKITYNDQTLKTETDSFDCFEVMATAPIIIKQPKLGYLLEYTLVKFIQSYNYELGIWTLQSQGYSYFKDIKPLKGFYKMRINNNREEVYRNSIMHLARSIYSNTTAENGFAFYRLTEVDSNYIASEDSLGYFKRSFQYMNKDVILADKIADFSSETNIQSNESEAYLCGVKERMYRVKYYESNGVPMNTNIFDRPITHISNSNMYFINDTCTIRKDGSLPGGEILFEGHLVNKRMGAALPYDVEF